MVLHTIVSATIVDDDGRIEGTRSATLRTTLAFCIEVIANSDRSGRCSYNDIVDCLRRRNAAGAICFMHLVRGIRHVLTTNPTADSIRQYRFAVRRWFHAALCTECAMVLLGFRALRMIVVDE